ncbi:MAG: xanthine dehydrogenase family protein molybdopterin-binding subunit [Acidimicrobiia bacterium]|nr:xanthine dehydrogenase family protein molybdopterin-binding subunit [Acidimicrobiia bacterium]
MLRVEDTGLLRGETAFVRDLPGEDCLHLALVRSSVAHGELVSVDGSTAATMPGVAAVVTAADLDLEPFRFFDPIPEAFARPLLATERVRMVGEIVAVVVADTAAHAVDAADTVVVEIRAEDPVLDPRTAADAPPLFAGTDSNVVMRYDRGRIDDLFDLAAHIERGRYPNQRLCSAPLEPTGVVVRPSADGGLDLWATGQGPHTIRREVARALGLPETAVRVRSVAVGGGFGGRHSAPAEVLVAAAVARHFGRAVRWDESRSENLATMVHGRAQDHTVEMGFDDDGRIVGLRVHNLADCGAYPHFGPLMPFMSRKLAPGPYRVPRVDYSWTAVATTTAPVGPYRGAGQPEVVNGLERTIENAARALGIDPLELRRRNLLRPDELGSPTATGQRYDSGDYGAALDRAAELISYDSVRAEQRRRRGAGESKQLGVGFACYVSVVDTSAELAEVGIGADGTIGVRCGTFSHGQSHASTIGALVAGELGVDPGRIRYADGDSEGLARGAGTGGSRSAQMGGGAAVLAAREVVARARSLAATLLEANPDDLVVTPASSVGPAGIGVLGAPAQVVSWERLATAAAAEGRPLVEAVDYAPESASHPSGTHASVVEVDVETGAVRLVAHVAVDDCGTVLNPTVVEGQQHGGSAAGIGQALLEAFVYDADGNPLTTTFADYLLASAAELPSFRTATMGIASPASATGAKGIGENGAIAAPTAVQNAVVDALAGYGVTHVDLPITPERVWRAVQDPAGASRDLA